MTDLRAPVLVLGGSGLLGQVFRQVAPRRVVATYATRPFAGGIRFRAEDDCVDDLLDALEVAPAAAIMLFGQTSIDACFRDPVATTRLNVDAAARIARALAARAVRTVYASSDAVFDGSRGFWRDGDAPRPLHSYGRQKLAAEAAVLRHTGSLVVRLPKLIVGDRHPACFISAWYDALSAGKPISCATDQRFNPVAAVDAAAAILALIEQQSCGVVHVATSVAVSRWDLLQRLIEQLGDGIDRPPQITPCRLADLGLSEPRPIDSSLAPSAVLASLPLRVRTPFEVIDEVANRLSAALRERH